MIKHYTLHYSLFLILMDVALVVTALVVATVMRMFIPFGLPGTAEQRLLPIPVYIIAVVVHLIIYTTMNVHSPRQVTTLLRELQVITGAALIAWLMMLGALYLSFRQVSRLQIAYFLVVHIALIYGSRITLRLSYFARGKQVSDTRNVLIIGENHITTTIHQLIQQYSFTGLHAVGVIPNRPDHTLPDNLPIIGTLDNLEERIVACDVREVVIALERDGHILLPNLVRRLQALPVNIRLVPQYADLAFLRVHIEDFSGMPLLTLKEPVLTPLQRVIKRAFDILMTLLILVPALPVMAVIAVMIKRDSPGPILFRQKRIGEGGKPFMMLKFRSMVDGAAFQQETVKRYDANGRPVYKHPEDPRVTAVGKFIRMTSLDELPQLFNILRGEMSLVGPRPEMPELVATYEPWQRKRFEVPQGLTGWWQVNGRANKPMHLNTEDDLFYIRNYSLWLDLQILWKTIWVVISRRGAF
jgi:exopolysaccharide biosynthesis polyprenyl glycosylphosphotransferase